MEIIVNTNFEELCGIALARLHISTDDFLNLAPIEFRYALKVVHEVDEQKFKLSYESMRYLGKHIWNAAGKSSKKWVDKVQDIDVFAWETDKETGMFQQSQEEIKQAVMNMVHQFRKRPDRSVATKLKEQKDG